jgi:pyrimidine-nucleoside phosphorylase
MPTISGRGLGHTGGTLDKMQAIPGFDVFLSLRRFKELTGNVGACFIGQTEEICPADRKIYALRDVTATVESLPLIVASIMSKKLAEGIDALVLDVKIGSGAFMKSKKEAEILAKALVDTAVQAGKKASALITDMSQPLGWCVGNAIEVNECVNFLRQGPQDSPVEKRLAEVTLALATELFLHAESIRGKKTSPAAAKETLLESLQNGKAYAKFLEIVSMQGGDTEAVDQGLPLAKKEFTLKSPKKGYLAQIDGEQIGYALIEMGGYASFSEMSSCVSPRERNRFTTSSPYTAATTIEPSLGTIERSTTSTSSENIPAPIIESPSTRTKKVEAGFRTTKSLMSSTFSI